MSGQPEPEAFYRARDGFSTVGPDGSTFAPRLTAVFRGDHWAVVKFPHLFELAVPEDADRRAQVEILALLRGSAPSSTEAVPDAADPWWTTTRIDRANEYRDAIRWLRRNGGASVNAAAKMTGIDRGTLKNWIARGRVEPPENVPER